MKLKLAWFSPVVPQPTEIANYTARLQPHLDAEFDVRYFTEDENGFLEIANGRRYACGPGKTPQEIFRELNLVDLPVYHVGHNPRFHVNTLFLSRRKPGLVVLHDRKLHHLMAAAYKHRLGNRHTYIACMRRYYGALGAEAAAAAWDMRISIDFMAEHFPLTQVAIENALGVIVHTKHLFAALTALTSNPVFRLPLPFPAGAAPAVKEASGDVNKKIRLVMFGFLGANRRVAEFLRALAKLRERDRFVVDLAGAIGNMDHVTATIAKLHLENSVTIHGSVEHTALDELLAKADLAINLHYPSMGSASSAQLRIWNSALPSLVTSPEGYAELPEEAVCFVRPECEEADIQRHLLGYLANPQSYREKGAHGRKMLESDHSPESYVRELRQIVRAAGCMRLRRTKCELADTIGRQIVSLGTSTGRAAFYAETISALFDRAFAP